MLFNSLEFIFLYIPIVVAVFFILGRYKEKKYAITWLVFASFFFYGWWDVWYVPLLFASICFNYNVGKNLELAQHKKSWLGLGIFVNISMLAYFKYMDFFLGAVNDILGQSCFDLMHIVLPLGISFFTFTQTAYLIDMYRGDTRNTSFIVYCEFVTIFPHLIAGPIISHRKMIPQFIDDTTFKVDYHNIALGLGLFSMGLFKKAVIADKLAIVATDVFSSISSIGMLEAWLGAVAYTFQLYFDFSGYSEMAMGLGLMLNLKLPQNFNSPYKATSVIDFWHRWHMTLSGWVREYLYIPMGGNRHGQLNKLRNLFVSMVIIGLWHGAGWTFIAWGALHGLFLIVNHIWRNLKYQLPVIASWGITFLCVVIGWVFFRAASVGDAVQIISKMFDISSLYFPSGGKWEYWLHWTGASFEAWQFEWSLAKCAGTLIVLLVCILTLKNPCEIYVNMVPNKKWMFFISLVFLASIYVICAVGTGEFLYFQF
ncbi:MBOAT family O-acyltransferase [Anaerovibrio sp.]|uniref:MBOAT family O-acyltransferase n=1 Tax=Anaerovibrio sp. TaxID=1872532 RepID=UPI003F18F20F